jgi:EmrB/QacA subfamily drug resistance transporter
MTETISIETLDEARGARVVSRAPEPSSFLKTRRGALTLGLLVLVQFLDFLDVSIVNVALPSIKHELGFSEQSLQWVVSGYVLTYGGFLLLGGRAADLVGRRRILVGGLILFALASLVGGAAHGEGLLISARLAQGIGAAMMSPAALSILTTTFTNPRDRNIALGAWAAVPGLAGASGVVLSGALTQGPGWRWIFYLNVLVATLAGIGAVALIARDGRDRRQTSFDASGALLVTAGMLLLIYALIQAPNTGWRTTQTIGELAASIVLLAAFVGNELRARNPLVPFSIFRIKGLAAANLTQLITFSGLYSMFFFLSLYMQQVLSYSPIHTGLAYLPLTVGFMIAAGIATPLLPRLGTKPVIIAGALIAAGGVYHLSHVPVDGNFLSDLLPGIGVVAIGVGAVFTGVTTAATEGVPDDKAGIASGLLNASMQFGGALGLAVLSAAATDRTDSVLQSGGDLQVALTAGFQRAFLIGAGLVLVAALIAVMATNTRAGEHAARLERVAEPIGPLGCGSVDRYVCARRWVAATDDATWRTSYRRSPRTNGRADLQEVT